MRKKEIAQMLGMMAENLLSVDSATAHNGKTELDLDDCVVGAAVALAWAKALIEGKVDDEGVRGNLTVVLSACARALAGDFDKDEEDGDE